MSCFLKVIVISRPIFLLCFFLSTAATGQILDTLYTKPYPCDYEFLHHFKDMGEWIYFESSGPTSRYDDKEFGINLKTFHLHRNQPVAGHFCNRNKRYLNDSVFFQGCSDPENTHYLKLNNSIHGTQTLRTTTYGNLDTLGNPQGFFAHKGEPIIKGISPSGYAFVLVGFDSTLQIQDTLAEVPFDTNATYVFANLFQTGHSKPIYWARIHQDSLRLEVNAMDSNLVFEDTLSLTLESLGLSGLDDSINPHGFSLKDHGSFFSLSWYSTIGYHVITLSNDLQYLDLNINVSYENDSCYFHIKYPNSPYGRAYDRFRYFQDPLGNWVLHTMGGCCFDGIATENYKLNSKILKFNPKGKLIWEQCIKPRKEVNGFTACIPGFYTGYHGSALRYGKPLADTAYVFVGYQTYGRQNEDSEIRVLVLDTAGTYQALSLPEHEITNEGFQVYPNPAKSQVTVKLNGNLSPGQIQVFDTNGRLLFQKAFTRNKFEINTSSWPAGLYHMVLSSESVRHTKRLVLN